MRQSMDWHRINVETSVVELGTDRRAGLSSEEASKRLQQYGRNELLERGGRSPLRIIWEQLTSVMVLILIAARCCGSCGGAGRLQERGRYHGDRRAFHHARLHPGLSR
jgi:hypothetical protein